MESTKAIYVLEERFFAGVQRCLGMRSGWFAVSGRMPCPFSKCEKGRKEERKFVRNDQERQEARHPILPLWGGSFVGLMFLGGLVLGDSLLE